jgi:chromosome segregation ATPase
MKNRVFAGVALVCVALIAVGCAKPPQQELDQAKASVAAAEQAEAAKYAPEAWEQAQRSMSAVNAELDAQNAKFALFRSYTKTKQLIADSGQAADQARDAALEGKQRARAEAQQAIDAANASAEQAQQLMADLENCRRKPKDLRKDLEMMRGNLDGYTSQLGEIQAAFDREDLFGAKSQAESLKGQIDAMAQELQDAKTKFRC